MCMDGPWVLEVNFNVIRFVNEKNNGGHITRSTRDFNNLVQEWGLRESLLSNVKFTWLNVQENSIICRLDKVLAFCD